MRKNCSFQWLIAAIGIFALSGCHRNTPTKAEMILQREQAVVNSELDKQRLKEIHERIEQLEAIINYQEMMGDRYTIVEDFYRQNRALQRIKVAKDEIRALEQEKARILERAERKSGKKNSIEMSAK